MGFRDNAKDLADKATGGKFTGAIDGAGQEAAEFVGGTDKNN